MPTDYNSKRDNSEGVDNKSKEKRYVNQPQHHGWEELAPEMKNFWSDFSTLAYEKTSRYPRFTSGKRTPEQKVGHAHATSKHNEGKAIDIAADYEMFNILYNTPDGLGLLNRYNLGVLDETSKAAMNKTGATGPHYHIGVDPALVNRASQRYNTYKETGNLQMIGLDRDITDTEFKIYAPATQQLEEDIAVEIEKEKKKEEKEEKSESRKKVSPNKEKSFFADIKLEQQKQEKYEPFQDTPQTKVQDILSDYSSISSDVQTKLPNIPSLFREITTKDLDKMQDGGRSKKEHLAFLSDPNTKPIYAHNLPKYNYADVSDPNNPFIDYRVQKPQLLKKPVITKYDDDNEEYSFIEKGTDEYRDVFNRGKESLKKDRLQTRADSILDRGYGNKEYIPSQRVLDRVAFQKAHWGEDKMGDTDIIENMIREEIYGDAGGIDSPKEARKATRYNQSAFDMAKSLLLSDEKMQDGGEISSSYNFDNIKKNIKLDLKNRSNFFAQNEIKLNNE